MLASIFSMLLELTAMLSHQQAPGTGGGVAPVPPPALASAPAVPPAAAPATQPATTPSATQPAAAPPAGFLAGPKADVPAEHRPTLVERNFDGTLVRLDMDPDMAAVLRLPLSEAARAQVEELVTDRLRWTDRFVRDHYRQIIEVRTAIADGQRPNPQMAERLLQPVRAHERFTAVAQVALTAKEVATARAMATEYRDALRAELRKAAPDASEAQIDARLEIEEFGRMVAQSIQRRADAANARLREVSETLELTPEQTERVRAIFMEYAVGAIQGSRPEKLSLREWNVVLRQLDEVLTEEQGKKLRALLAQRAER